MGEEEITVVQQIEVAQPTEEAQEPEVALQAEDIQPIEEAQPTEKAQEPEAVQEPEVAPQAEEAQPIEEAQQTAVAQQDAEVLQSEQMDVSPDVEDRSIDQDVVGVELIVAGEPDQHLERVQDLEIGLRFLLHAFPPQLDDHAAAVPQRRAVDLGDRRRGQGCAVDMGEHVAERAAEVGLEFNMDRALRANTLLAPAQT